MLKDFQTNTVATKLCAKCRAIKYKRERVMRGN
jgi:hypothetical protein